MRHRMFGIDHMILLIVVGSSGTPYLRVLGASAYRGVSSCNTTLVADTRPRDLDQLVALRVPDFFDEPRKLNPARVELTKGDGIRSNLALIVFLSVGILKVSVR